MRNETLHKQIAKGLGDTNISPAVLANMMKREPLYVQESLIQYLINYVIMISNTNIIPPHLKEVKDICDLLHISFQELGLTGDTRMPVDTNEYLAV
jgi:hypothetical protein